MRFFGGCKKSTQELKSPVYSFFADATNKDKKRAYSKAIRDAEKDQKDLISKYDREFAGTSL